MRLPNIGLEAALLGYGALIAIDHIASSGRTGILVRSCLPLVLLVYRGALAEDLLVMRGGRWLILLLLLQRSLLTVLELLPVKGMCEARVLAYLTAGLAATSYVQESVL